MKAGSENDLRLSVGLYERVVAALAAGSRGLVYDPYLGGFVQRAVHALEGFRSFRLFRGVS